MGVQISTTQCSFDPLDLSLKFLPIAFLELFGFTFSCFFGGGLRRCCHEGDLSVGVFAGAGGCEQQQERFLKRRGTRFCANGVRRES